MKKFESIRCLIIVLVVTILMLSKGSDAWAQEPILPERELAVVFAAPSAHTLPPSAKQAVVRAMNTWPGHPPDSDTFYLIGLRWETSWALATLTSADLDVPLEENQHTHLDASNLIALILVETESGWEGAVDRDDRVQNLLSGVPESELSESARLAIFPPKDQIRQSRGLSQQYNSYKFPWPSGPAWWMSNPIGWHDTDGYPPGLALDFDVVNYPNSDILAAASGTVVWICEGYNDQYFLSIRTDGTNEQFGYLHLDGATVRGEGIQQGSHVIQGQKLGRMREADDQVVQDQCGVSRGTHIHLNFPSKPFTIDGVIFTHDEVHYRVHLYSSQTGGDPPDSTAPTITFTIPTEERWYNTDQTLSWTITDDHSGVDHYKWAWNTNPPTNRVNSSSGSTKLSDARQGRHDIYVQAWDKAGNPSAVERRGWFGYDTVAPSTPTINPGCTASDRQWQNSCRAPNFSWSAVDPNGSAASGVVQYAYAWGTSASGDPSNWSANTQYSPGPIAAAGDSAQYYLHVKAKDRAGNISNVSTFGLWHDGSPPTASIAINNGAATSNQTTVQVHLSATDTGSGVAEVRLSHNGFDWAPWQPYAEVVPWAIPALNRREIPVYAQVRDRAGNLSAVVSDAITLDLYPLMPHSASFRICNNVINTGGSVGLISPSFSLTSAIGQPWQSGPEPGTSTSFNQRGGFLADLGSCRPISHTVGDRLAIPSSVIAAGGGLRSSTSFRLGDTAGEPAASGADALTSASYLLSSGFWGNAAASACPQPITAVDISGPATGTVNTLLNFEVAITPADATPPLIYTWSPTPETGQGTTKAAYRFGTTGERAITVTVANCGGAVDASRTVTVLPAPPEGFGVSINEGALYTNDLLVTVRTWAPSSIVDMRLSNDGGYADQGWQVRQESVPWEIESHSNYVLPRTVYVWFKDAQNQVYGPHSDDIIYDPIPPTGSVSIQSRDGDQVTLSLTATDDNSGVAQMRIAASEGAIQTKAWQPFVSSTTISLTEDTAYAQFRDHAGNVSRIYASDGSSSEHQVYLPLVLRGH